MADLLRMDHINSLPQPFLVLLWGGDIWPLYDIDVETGLLRIDVCGKLQVMHISDVSHIKDGDGNVHDSADWYVEE